jgi:hypothetical protein
MSQPLNSQETNRDHYMKLCQPTSQCERHGKAKERLDVFFLAGSHRSTNKKCLLYTTNPDAVTLRGPPEEHWTQCFHCT